MYIKGQWSLLYHTIFHAHFSICSFRNYGEHKRNIWRFRNPFDNVSTKSNRTETIEETITRMKTQMTATEEKDDENLSLNELKHKGMMRDIYQMLGIALPIKTAILHQDLLYI